MFAYQDYGRLVGRDATDSLTAALQCSSITLRLYFTFVAAFVLLLYFHLTQNFARLALAPLKGAAADAGAVQ